MSSNMQQTCSHIFLPCPTDSSRWRLLVWKIISSGKSCRYLVTSSLSSAFVLQGKIYPNETLCIFQVIVAPRNITTDTLNVLLVSFNMIKLIAYYLPIICTIWTFFIWVSCAGTIIRYTYSTCRSFQPDLHFWFHLFSCYFSHCNTFVLVSFTFPTKVLCLLSNIRFHTTKCGQCTNKLHDYSCHKWY